ERSRPRRSPAVPDVAPWSDRGDTMRWSMRKQRREPDGRDRQDGQDTNRIVPAVLVILAATFSWTLASAQQPTASVTSQDLRDGLKNPTRWLTYGGDYGNLRHSPLTQITPANVNRLVPQWQL